MAEIDPWKTRSDEEEAHDLFIEEEGKKDDEETRRKKKEAQDETTKAGMLPVAGSEWIEKLKEILIEASEDLDKETGKTLPSDKLIFESVEKVSKATCLVLRRTDSKGRLKYLKEKGDHERLENAKKGGGNGTGFLIFPKSPRGWLVITNNHVIMDEEEARSAEVIFDYLDDDSAANTKRFRVKELVSKGTRSKGSKDLESLDFSVLALKSDEPPQEIDGITFLDSEDDFLREHAEGRFDEGAGIEACENEDILKMAGLKFVPFITISHPRGLAKRLSIRKYPGKCEKLKNPDYIKHDLPTTPGSSGAQLLFFHPLSDNKFVFWEAAFLHYRHRYAVAWGPIGAALREDFMQQTVKQDVCCP